MKRYIVHLKFSSLPSGVSTWVFVFWGGRSRFHLLKWKFYPRIFHEELSCSLIKANSMTSCKLKEQNALARGRNPLQSHSLALICSEHTAARQTVSRSQPHRTVYLMLFNPVTMQVIVIRECIRARYFHSLSISDHVFLDHSKESKQEMCAS